MPPNTIDGKPFDAKVSFPCYRDDVESWKRAAAERKISFSEYLRLAANRETSISYKDVSRKPENLTCAAVGHSFIVGARKKTCARCGHQESV